MRVIIHDVSEVTKHCPSSVIKMRASRGKGTCPRSPTVSEQSTDWIPEAANTWPQLQAPNIVNSNHGPEDSSLHQTLLLPTQKVTQIKEKFIAAISNQYLLISKFQALKYNKFLRSGLER